MWCKPVAHGIWGAGAQFKSDIPDKEKKIKYKAGRVAPV